MPYIIDSLIGSLEKHQYDCVIVTSEQPIIGKMGVEETEHEFVTDAEARKIVYQLISARLISQLNDKGDLYFTYRSASGSDYDVDCSFPGGAFQFRIWGAPMSGANSTSNKSRFAVHATILSSKSTKKIKKRFEK